MKFLVSLNKINMFLKTIEHEHLINLLISSKKISSRPLLIENSVLDLGIGVWYIDYIRLYLLHITK